MVYMALERVPYETKEMNRKRLGQNAVKIKKAHEIKFKNLDFMRFCFRRFNQFQ